MTLNKRRVATNSTSPIGGFSCSADSFVVADSFGLRINIVPKNPTDRKSEIHWTSHRTK